MTYALKVLSSNWGCTGEATLRLVLPFPVIAGGGTKFNNEGTMMSTKLNTEISAEDKVELARSRKLFEAVCAVLDTHDASNSDVLFISGHLLIATAYDSGMSKQTLLTRVAATWDIEYVQTTSGIHGTHGVIH